MTDIWIKIEAPTPPPDDPEGPASLAGWLVQLVQQTLPPIDGQPTPVSAFVGTPTGMHYDDQADGYDEVRPNPRTRRRRGLARRRRSNW